MKPFFFYLGVFLISGSTLVLQIVQTRILSVVAWYHLAFFVISLAMFGLTAGAVWVYLRAPWFWGINGAAGALASISAIAVSLALGIASTLILGALCYLLLIPVSLALFQSAPVKASKRPATPARRVTG